MEASGGDVGATSPPGGNQVDGLPPASSWNPRKNRPICNFGCLFLFKLMNSFMMRCCHWYFCHQVRQKRKPGSYSAIHFLDESEMSRTREILENLVIFNIFKIFKIFENFSFFSPNLHSDIIHGILRRGSRLDESSRRKLG